MLRQQTKRPRPGEPELRKFGLLVGGVLAALGLVLWLRHRPACPYFLIAAALLIGGGLAEPRALRPVQRVWMMLALALGWGISNLLLIALFFLGITPIGLAARCLGRDFLGLKIDRAAPSYWFRRERKGPKSPAEYERQF